MIKLTKYLRVNILTIIMFTVCVIFHYPAIFYITYAVMFLHEMAHCIAAVCIGLKIDYIVFLPFGVNLRLKNKMVFSLADEVILYISGPLCNVVFALLAAVICKKYNYEIFRMFYISNIVLFLINMLPALPLDGGIILRRFLMSRYGYKSAMRIMKFITAIVAAWLIFLGVGAVMKIRFNFSLLLFAMLLVGNIFTQREKYDVDFVRELMFHKKKNKRKIHHLVVNDGSDPREIADKFSAGSYNIIYLTDSEGKISDTLTETQVINQLMDNNITIS
ncbi:MAG: site-2 protease family protein [Oscillospiraceae bacterium]|nr:site-2 protease family protein [Oscillospiraceae bacterium]